MLDTLAPGRRNMTLHGHAAFSEPVPVKDTNFGGVYKVKGSTAVAGTPDTPVARKIRLILARSGRLARETISTASGNYEFLNVGVGPWVIISHDHTGEYNAVVADNILAEPM